MLPDAGSDEANDGWSAPRIVQVTCSVLTLAVALAVMVGWAFDVAPLKSVSSGFITMKANTALGLMLLAGAVLALDHGRQALLARLLATTAAVLALATLAEYLLRVDLGIDQLLFRDPDTSGRFPPGRLAPITATSFVLLALAVWCAGPPRPRHERLSQGLTLAAFVTAFQAAVGYAFGVTYSFGSAFYTQIALHTAVLLVLVCVGLLAARPRAGLMAVFLAPTRGGRLARRLIGAAVVVPPAVNYVQLVGQRVGLYDADFGVLLRVIGNVIFFAIIVWRNTAALHQSDLQRLGAEMREREATAQNEGMLRRLNAELEERVAQRTQELADANAELESFSYSVSHDLRAPLRAIHSFSAIVEEDCASALPAESREHLARIRANAERMTQLIEDLLQLARVSKRELERSTVDVSAMAHAIAEELSRSTPERKATWAIAEGLEARADSRLLRVALENLMSNAFKFTGRRPDARIEIGHDKASGAFFVRDNGAGFDMTYAERLFAPFRRLHAVADFPGTGVGLATVQRIVRRHGGRIWAKAALQEGATFFFTLAPPIAAAEPAHRVTEPARATG